MKFKDYLDDIDACNEAIEWVDNKGFKKSWATCDRGDWMMWYIGKNISSLGLEDMRLITLAKGLQAQLVIHLMNDERSINAVEVAIKFGNNKATLKELNSAAYADASDTAADASATAATATAAYTAATAAYARKKILSECADICREVFKNAFKKN